MTQKKSFLLKLCLAFSAALLIAGCIPVKIVVSPDGRLAWRDEEEIVVSNSDGSEKKVFLEGKDLKPLWIEWSPDGKAISVSGEKKGSVYFLMVLDPDTGKERLLLEHTSMIWIPKWSPSARFISYYIEQKSEEGDRVVLKVADLVTGSHRILAKTASLDHAWSPDGKTIAVATSEDPGSEENYALGGLGFIDVASGKMTFVAGVLFWPYMVFSFSQDGKTLYFTSPSEEFPVLVGKEVKDFTGFRLKSAAFAYDLEAQKITRITPKDQNAVYFTLSPDGKHLLYIDSKGYENVLEGDVFACRTDGTQKKKMGKNIDLFMPTWLDSTTLFLFEKHSEEKKELNVFAADVKTGEKKVLDKLFKKK